MKHSEKGPWVATLFGLPFIASGVFFTLTGFGVCPLPGDEPSGPLWVIGCVGLVFGVAGLLVFGAGIAGWITLRRRKAMRRLYPNEPWMVDYAWDRERVRSAGFAGVLGSVFGLGFFCVFLAPFHWWAWMSDEGGWMIRVIVGIFELVAACFVIGVLRLLIQWLKFGRTQLRFARFPFHPGEKLDVAFSPSRFDRLDVTLRFRKRTVEDVGSGDDQSARIVTETIHELHQEIECTVFDFEVPIVFDLPEKLGWVNRISEQPSYYWEMEIKAEASGVDFDEAFKLPVYASQRSRGTRDAAATSNSRGAMLITD